MNRVRFLVAVLIAWLFLFYNLERISKPIDISDVAYTFVPAMIIVVVLGRNLRKLPLWLLLMLPIPVFLALKAAVRSSMLGASLPLTVTELCATMLATVLAREVSKALSEFESAVAYITIRQIGKLPESLLAGQDEIYKEVRRARRFQRPLTLMAIRIKEESIEVALDRMVQQVQQAMMRQYVTSSVSKVLCDELDDCNIIAQNNDHFIVALPEVMPGTLPDLTRQLRGAIAQTVGVALQIGTASLPHDATTYEGLLEKAEREMRDQSKPEPSPNAKRSIVEHLLHDNLQDKSDGTADHQAT